MFVESLYFTKTDRSLSFEYGFDTHLSEIQKHFNLERGMGGIDGGDFFIGKNFGAPAHLRRPFQLLVSRSFPEKELTFNFYVYEGRGTVLVGVFSPLNTIREVAGMLEIVGQRKFYCSSCENVFDRPAHRYSSGIYCEGCWVGTTGEYVGIGGYKDHIGQFYRSVSMLSTPNFETY